MSSKRAGIKRRRQHSTELKLEKTGAHAVTPGMTEPTSAQDLFKGRHFDQEIIILCVRWYLTFKLSSRDLVQMMAERGITVGSYDDLAVGAALRAGF